MSKSWEEIIRNKKKTETVSLFIHPFRQTGSMCVCKGIQWEVKGIKFFFFCLKFKLSLFPPRSLMKYLNLNNNKKFSQVYE
jgi:hypothetical protein